MTINDVSINYVIKDNGFDKWAVLLHGWGQNIQMMEPLCGGLEDTCNILIVDLPGFGLSTEPKKPYTIDDYADTIHKLLSNLKIDNPIMIGHSFGGRVSIKYASKYNVRKLVLLASPFRKSEMTMTLKTKILKNLKKVPILNKMEGFAKKHIGSRDYKNATPIMRQILVNAVNEDLKEDGKKITCPTIIIYGTLDEEVTEEDAREIESTLKDAALIIYEGCTHYAYLERIDQTNNILRSFVSEEVK